MNIKIEKLKSGYIMEIAEIKYKDVFCSFKKLLKELNRCLNTPQT
jgi:hypothetical protein